MQFRCEWNIEKFIFFNYNTAAQTATADSIRFSHQSWIYPKVFLGGGGDDNNVSIFPTFSLRIISVWVHWMSRALCKINDVRCRMAWNRSDRKFNWKLNEWASLVADELRCGHELFLELLIPNCYSIATDNPSNHFIGKTFLRSFVNRVYFGNDFRSRYNLILTGSEHQNFLCNRVVQL